MKKITALLLTLLLAVASLSVAVSADSAVKEVTLRIEGVNGNLYESKVQTSATNVEDLLKEVDTANTTLDITMKSSTYGAYVSAVNGESEATFGGYDGWMFLVNGVASNVGITATTIANGDSIVLYYSDAYGVGFQYPVVDTSKIKEGILTFTSKDTTYDASYNPIETVNPVAGMTVTWYDKTQSTTYVTDAKGQITIPVALLTKGDHSIAIDKKSANGVPMVLRYSKNQVVSLTEDVVADVNSGNTANLWIYPLLLAAAGVLLVRSNRKAYEK